MAETWSVWVPVESLHLEENLTHRDYSKAICSVKEWFLTCLAYNLKWNLSIKDPFAGTVVQLNCMDGPQRIHGALKFTRIILYVYANS